MEISTNIGYPSIIADRRWERAAFAAEAGASAAGPNGSGAAAAPAECQTCKNRTYVDGSDDPSVSFKTPSNLSPSESFGAVRSHELEHVVNENAKAKENGGRVISQRVMIRYAVCPECGRSYAAGGTTTTVTLYETGRASGTAAKIAAPEKKGAIVDRRA